MAFLFFDSRGRMLNDKHIPGVLHPNGHIELSALSGRSRASLRSASPRHRRTQVRAAVDCFVNKQTAEVAGIITMWQPFLYSGSSPVRASAFWLALQVEGSLGAVCQSDTPTRSNNGSTRLLLSLRWLFKPLDSLTTIAWGPLGPAVMVYLEFSTPIQLLSTPYAITSPRRN
jgi:hypothetical protein